MKLISLVVIMFLAIGLVLSQEESSSGGDGGSGGGSDGGSSSSSGGGSDGGSGGDSSDSGGDSGSSDSGDDSGNDSDSGESSDSGSDSSDNEDTREAEDGGGDSTTDDEDITDEEDETTNDIDDGSGSDDNENNEDDNDSNDGNADDNEDTTRDGNGDGGSGNDGTDDEESNGDNDNVDDNENGSDGNEDVGEDEDNNEQDSNNNGDNDNENSNDNNKNNGDNKENDKKNDNEGNKNGGNRNLCMNKNCNDNNQCTKDYCNKGVCYNVPVSICEINETKEQKDEGDIFDKIQLSPEYAKYLLLNEFPGVNFGIETNKKEYNIGEDVWTKINAPDDSDIELSFSYDGFQHYIKIPKDKGYPLDYLLPLPRNLKKGIYEIRAAIYYAGNIIKTYASFKIDDKGDTIDYSSALFYIEEISEKIEGEEPLDVAEDDKGDNTLNSEIVEDSDTFENNFIEAVEKKSDEVEEEPTGTDTIEISSDNKNEEKDIIEHEPIKVGQPVKWSKNISIEKYNNKIVQIDELIDIPKNAVNLKVVEANSKNIVIEFKTKAPLKTEKLIVTGDEWKKEVTISSDEEYLGEYEYKNVLSHTDIRESEKENIRLFWKVNGEKVDVTNYDLFNVTFYDTNNNGLIDRISWITPHLSTQEFEVVITLTTSTGSGLNINLLNPDGTSYKASSGINFKFVVSYNKSLDVWCNLSVDNTLIQDITVSDGQEIIIKKDINFSEGIHDWNIYCKDELNNIKQSSTNSFVIDLTPPTIELNNDDPDLSLTDSIDLIFVATDNLASPLSCSLTLNGIQNETTISATSSLSKTISLSGLENGTYEWNVTCLDIALNSYTSITKTFYIDTKRNFSITPNKESYSIGEGGIYWVISPYSAKVTLVITTPKSATITRSYSGTFPQVDDIDFLDYPGTYTIDGFLNYNGAIKIISISFNVVNTLSASIYLDKSKITKGGSVKFTGSASGGIGDLSYSWDFGDKGDAATGKSVTHTYSELGNYGAKLTVTDSKGNEDTESVTIRVEEQYIVDIIVKDADTNTLLEDVNVYLQGSKKTTDSSGKVSYSVFRGDQGILVRHDSYYSYYNRTLITESTALNIQLKKSGNDTVSNEKQVEVAGNLSKELTDESLEEEYKIGDVTEETANEDIKGLISLINNALESIDTLNADDKETASSLDLINYLEKAKVNLKRADRDLYHLGENRRNLSNEEIETRRDEINEVISRTRDNNIKTAHVLESDEFVKYPENSEIEDTSLEFLKSTNITLDNEKKDYFVNNNKEIQSLITVTTKIKKVAVEYISGDKKEIVLIVNDIKVEGDILDTSLIISIPKDIVENVDDIEILTSHKVLNPDPLIEFDLTKTKEIVYYIKKEVDLKKLKDIKTVLIFNPEKLEYKKSGIGIIGYAVFSKISGIDNPAFILEVIAIIILLIIYLAYQFNIIDKLKKGVLLKNKDLEEINGLIRDINVCLENNETENASVVYSDIMKAYKTLSPENKSKIHKETSSLYNKLIFTQLNDSLNTTLAHLKDNDVKQAKSNYGAIKELYGQLSKEFKAKISERCNLVFEKIAAIPK